MSKAFTIKLTLILVALAVLTAIVYQKCHRTAVVLVTQTDSVQYWKNQAGKNMATVIKSQDDFARVSSKVDSLARLLKVKPKTILSTAQVITRSRDTLAPRTGNPADVVYYPTDTTPHPDRERIRMLSETFWNDYYTADVRIDAEGDSSFMRIQSTDTITLDWRQIRVGGLFNRQTLIALDATNANPNNTIIGLSGHRIPQKTNAWNRWIKPTLVGAAVGFITYKLAK